jgi:hypothetical protein
VQGPVRPLQPVRVLQPARALQQEKPRPWPSVPLPATPAVVCCTARRALLGAVAHHHGRQLQALAVFAGERQANEAAPKAGHEIDGLGTHVLGGQHQIALVFAVLFVDQDDHFPGAHIGHDVLNRGNRYRRGGGGGHRVTFGFSCGAACLGAIGPQVQGRIIAASGCLAPSIA